MEKAETPQVLLLDEDASFSDWASKILELCGIECVIASSVGEAEQAIKKASIACAIISADSGPALLRFGQGVSRHKSRPLPVAYVTADKADEAAMLEAHYYHGVYLMQKPLSPSQMLAWVGSLLLIDRRIKEMLGRIDLLEQQASTDPLTGLFNRRLFFRRFEEELSRAARSDGQVGLAYLDLDHFKRINDTYGHNAGDMVLRLTADVLKNTLRISDIIGRIGGEEFLVLLPATAPEQSVMIAERLREKITQHDFRVDGDRLDVTISAGVCTAARPADTDPAEMVELADRALYQAKEGGRNRVVQCSPPMPAREMGSKD